MTRILINESYQLLRKKKRVSCMEHLPEYSTFAPRTVGWFTESYGPSYSQWMED